MSNRSGVRESHFQNFLIREAKLCGWLVSHFRTARSPSGRFWTPVQGDIGFPDLVLVREDSLCIVELKRDLGRLSKMQHRWLSLLSRHLPCVGVWRPNMMDEVRVFLETGKVSDFCGSYRSLYEVSDDGEQE